MQSHRSKKPKISTLTKIRKKTMTTIYQIMQRNYFLTNVTNFEVESWFTKEESKDALSRLQKEYPNNEYWVNEIEVKGTRKMFLVAYDLPNGILDARLEIFSDQEKAEKFAVKEYGMALEFTVDDPSL